MSYRQPADDPALRERARRERAEAAEREDVSAERGTFTGYDAPAARALGGAGGPGGGGTPVPAAPAPDPDDPDTGPLTLMRDAEVDDALTRVTLTFSRAVDLASAQVPGRFTITEKRTGSPDVGVATPYTVSTPDNRVVLTFSSTLHPNTVHWITVNALTSDLHAYEDPGVFLAQGVRTAVFDTTLSPLEVTGVEHTDDYMGLIITFSRAIATDLGSSPGIVNARRANPGTDPVTYTDNRATALSATGSTLMATLGAALSADTAYVLHVINPTAPADAGKGIRDTVSPPSYLVRAPATEHETNFMTDPAPAFVVRSAEYDRAAGRVIVTMSGPVNPDTVMRTSVAIVSDIDGVHVAIASQGPSVDGRVISVPIGAIRRPHPYTVTVLNTVQDIFGQSVASGGRTASLTTRAPFNVVGGSVSTAMRTAPYTVSFEFNRAVNPDTLEDDDGNPIVRARQDVAQNPNSFTPESMTVSDDGETVVLTFARRLSPATGWVLDVPSTVESADGDTIVGVQQKFTVEQGFFMVRAPHLPAATAHDRSGSSHAFVWFTLSHDDVASIQGRGTVTRLDQAQFRATVDGTDAWKDVTPWMHVDPPTIMNRRRSFWRFQVKDEYVGSGRTLRFELPSSLMTVNGLAFEGGDGGTLVNGWWRWEVTLSGAPLPAQLLVRRAYMPGNRSIVVEFAESVLPADARRASNWSLRTTSGAATSNSISSRSVNQHLVSIGLRSPLSPGQGIRLVMAAGIRSLATSPSQKATREQTFDVLWGGTPTSAFTVLRSEWDGERARAKFYFSKSVRPGNNRAYFSYTRALGGRVASAIGSNTARGFIVDIDFRTPIPAGNHRVRADTDMLSLDGTRLTGTEAQRSLEFAIAGPAPGFTLPRRYPAGDSFSVGSITAVIAYSPSGSLALIRSQLQNTSNWSVTGADKSVNSLRAPRENRFPRITRIRVTSGSTAFPLYDRIEFTLSIPPRFQAIWQFRGPSPRFGNDVSREFERVTLTT